MLTWLKRRAKGTITNRYINHLFRSNNISSTNMFVPEPPVPLLNDHSLKLTVFNTNGEDYSFEIPNITTVENVKKMAIGHFFGHLEAVRGSLAGNRGGINNSKGNGNSNYRLVVVREARPLLDIHQLLYEKVIDNDVLLLVECREPPPNSHDFSPEDVFPPSKLLISTETAHLPKRHFDRNADPANPSTDSQTEFRRILVTMIEASVRLISADRESDDVFDQILDKLEKRHRPRVDRVSLRQLMEMGFVEAKATKALQLKRGFNEAVEWLLEEANVEDGDFKTGEELGSLLTDASRDSKFMVEDTQADPAKKILRRFLDYRKKWFQPNQQALKAITDMGYREDQVIDALRAANNNEKAAVDILLDKQEIGAEDQGLERDSPIISAIMASPVIQLALPKPKTLLALMMLFESPNNANMWLSDPDTHPVVSQVLRIYHAEKHSLNPSRPRVGAAASKESASKNSSSSEYRPQPSAPIRSNATFDTHLANHSPAVTSISSGSSSGNSSSYPAGNPSFYPGSDYTPNVFSAVSESQSVVNATFGSTSLGSQGSNAYQSSWSSGGIQMFVVQASPSSSPLPAMRAGSMHRSPLGDEPMSQSGSPIRGQSAQADSSSVNGGFYVEASSNMTQRPVLQCMQTPPQTDIADVEMNDTGLDTQDMDIQ